MSHRAFGLLSLLATLALVVACSIAEKQPDPRPVTVPAPARDAAKPTDYAGLHNVVAYGDGLYSGSAPEGRGLETLADMGIRTIISVDGAQPEADEARALGLRYVHLPIGYDGMDESRKLELARAVRDLPGPIYLHCHHGKHRSAGAAAAVAVSLGRLSNEQALARMKVSGTAPNYKGLYACATDTGVATEAQLDEASNEFPSHWKTTGLVQSMVEIDVALDNLKAIENASWKAPSDHPDLVPVAEAGRLTHLMRALNDDPEVRGQASDYHALLAKSIEAADALENGFLRSEGAAQMTERMKVLGQSCKDCHAKYRD